MPPLTKQQEKALMNGAKTIFALAKIDTPSGTTPSSPEKEVAHQLAEEFVNYRNDHLAYYNNYQDLKSSAFPRIAAFYLDTSGTPQGEEKNIAFLSTLATEEGKAKFAKKCAADILNMDLRKCMPSGDIARDVLFYSEHAQQLELCWVVEDLLNESKYLNPEVTKALQERSAIYQSAGHYQLCTRAAANQFFPLLPDLTAEDTAKLDKFEHDNDADEVPVDTELYDSFFDYADSVHGLHALNADSQRIHKISELEKAGTITPYTYATDEDGNRLSLDAAAGKLLNGQTVSFAEDAAAKPIISSYIKEAEKPISMPKKDDALYDTFSNEALSAQGKGFQAECARLSKVMDKAKLWYTGGSTEFKNISRLLKETASADNVPNKEESLQVMEQILRNCSKYLADQKHTGALKAREQKRYDAISEIQESMLKKKQFLSNARIKGITEHLQSEMNGPGMETPFHASERNQANYHTNKSEQMSGIYLNSLRSLKGEDGMMRTLALDTESFVNGLCKYAQDKSDSPNIMAYVNEGVSRSLAKVVLMEMVRQERAEPRHSDKEEPGQIETKLETIFSTRETDKRWNETIVNVSRSSAIQELADSICENPQRAADYLSNNGYKKLLGEVTTELKQKHAKQMNETKKVPVHEQGKKLPGNPTLRNNG